MKPEEVNSIQDAAMFYREHHGDIFTEAYLVCGSIEVVVNSRYFKIEPVQSIATGERHFDVHVYELKDDAWELWIGFGRCDRPTAHDVMMQALGFFEDAFGRK